MIFLAIIMVLLGICAHQHRKHQGRPHKGWLSRSQIVMHERENNT
jgi:hypothetical protein